MLITDFLVFLEVEKGYSPKTIREYAYDLQMFNGFQAIEDIPIEKRSTTDLRRFFLYLNLMIDHGIFMKWLRKPALVRMRVIERWFISLSSNSMSLFRSWLIAHRDKRSF